MIQDIEKIKKELNNHIEIDITFPILPGTFVKYITLNNDDEESFYLGGEYVKKGYEKIFLRLGKKTWAIQSNIRDNQNYIRYSSRFFIHKDNLKEKKQEKIIEQKEYDKIIKSQQKVIDKLSKQIINYQKIINNQNQEIQKLKR